MPKDINKGEAVIRYRVGCKSCSEVFLVYGMFSSLPEHPKTSVSDEPDQLCPGSGKPGNLIKTVPARGNSWHYSLTYFSSFYLDCLIE